MAEKFLRHDPPKTSELEAMEGAILRTWQPVVRAMRKLKWHEALGSSATIYQLMLAAHLETHDKAPKQKDRLTITLAALRRIVAWLSRSTSAQRIQLPGLDPRREDIALSTGVVLLAWMEGCGVARLRYAPGSLREGLVVDYFIRHYRRRSVPIDGPLAEFFTANGDQGR